MPPYWGMSQGQYSSLTNDLGNMDPGKWSLALNTIARILFRVQPASGRTTIIVPNNRSVSTNQLTLLTDNVRQTFNEAGYHCTM